MILTYCLWFQLVSVGDVVQGHVTDKSPRELTIQVTSFVGTHKHRELSDIGIKVSLQQDNVDWPHANLHVVYQARAFLAIEPDPSQCLHQEGSGSMD